MRKFTTILVAVVLCLATFVVCTSAAISPECEKGNHDWSAWVTADLNADGSLHQVRACACGAEDIRDYHEECAEFEVVIPAVAPTCSTPGLTEGVKCSICGEIHVAQEEVAPIAHTVEHVEAKTVVCGDAENGNIEYWYCTVCGYAWLDEARTQVTNLQSVKLPEAHNVEHVAAKAPTATENGNIEYWYCKDCGYAWIDELCTKNTNLKAVILPATGEPSAPSNPDTGDNAIFFVVALVAVATLGVAAVSFKKREN